MAASRGRTPGRSRRGGPSGALALVVVLALALGIFLLNGGDPGTPTGNYTATPIPTDVPTASPSTALAGDPDPGEEQGDGIAVADLPTEARETLALIDAGGPYPYDEDDRRFGNYEGLLPERERGYYREYTVETPGLDHRGPRRIVAGAGGELYWTDDHYASFERILR